MKKMKTNAGKGSTGKKKLVLVFSLVTVLVTVTALGLVGKAIGSSEYLNGGAGIVGFNPQYGTSYTCRLCHTTDSGSPSSPRNSFGVAWASSTVGNHQIPMTPALAAADSDGDTFSNSAEITARTYPGDSSSRPGDTTRPSLTINQATGQADPTSASPINFTVVFSETVTGFATGDVTIGGTAGATTATVTGSGTTYNVAVSGMTSAGTVVVSIAANVAQDAAGNLNTASTSTDNTVNYSPADTTRPSVTINQAVAQADPTSASPINFTVVFSETVTGFATGDVTISGTAGATTATVTGSGTTYNVAVSGTTSAGTVTVTIAANVAQDTAGNLNTASTSTDNTVNYTPPSVLDTIPPTITAFTVPSTATSLTVSSTISATDTVGVTAFMCTESSTKPDVNHPDWKPPTSPGTYSGTHTFATPGAKTLRSWAKDAAGNISTSKTAHVTITLSPPPEPDMTLWVGTWFKVKITGQEYLALNPGGDSEEETSAYLKISGWDPDNQILQSSLYQYDPSLGEWVSDPMDLHCVPGKALDFRTWTQVVGDVTYGFAAQIKGTVKAGVLRTATIKTLGGYYARMRSVENEGEDDVAGWLKINGTLVPESKVPPEIL